jgi:hypothetical protein
MQPGPKHSAMRRIFKESIGSHLIVKYDPLIEQMAQKLVAEFNDFEDSPLGALQRYAILFSTNPNTSSHFDRVTGEVVVTIAYGPAVFEAYGQELVDLNVAGIKEVAHQGSKFWLVEYIPLCESPLALNSSYRTYLLHFLNQ